MSASDYQSRADRMLADAKAAHKDWVKGLTAEQRKKLIALGVLEPPDDNHEVGGHSPLQVGDIADSPLSRVDPDFAPMDDESETLADQFDLTLPTAKAILAWHDESVKNSLRSHEADLLSVVVGGLLASKNVRIASAGLAFAANMAAANGLGSQADFARSIRVSRTIVSKSVKAWKRQLNLHTNAFQKSEEACATYAVVAKDRHWRKQKVTASALKAKLASHHTTKQ